MFFGTAHYSLPRPPQTGHFFRIFSAKTLDIVKYSTKYSIFAAKNERRKAMQYTVIIEKDPESGWYVGQCEEIPGAVSQGETYEELMENMKDAITLMLEFYRDGVRAENKGRKVFYRKLELA